MSLNGTKIGGAFCGDPFWFDDELGPSNVPHLTWCFQHTVLSAVPVLFLLIMTPVLYLQISMSHLPPIKWNLLTSMKFLITIALLVVKVLLFLWTIWQALISKQDVPIIEYIYPFEHILALIALIKLNTKCREGGITSSGIIFCTWLLFVLTGIPEFYSWFTNGTEPNMVATVDFYRYLLFLIWFPLTVIQLFLHVFAEKSLDSMYENICPESTASFISALFFTWFNPIVATGHKKALEPFDLFRLESDMMAAPLFDKWKERWTPLADEYHEALKSAKIKAALDETYNETITVSDSTPLLGDEKGLTRQKDKGWGSYGSTAGKSEGPKPEHEDEKELIPIPSVGKVLFSMFKWQFLGGTMIKLGSDMLQFVNPMLLSVLITFTEDATAPLWQGIAIAFVMFFSGILRSLFLNNYFQTMARIGTQIQSILTTAVFHKTLSLSNGARKGRTVGEIVNLMAIDVERFQALVQMSQQYWSTPLQIVISLVLLYQTMGISFIGGVIVMLLIIPLNMFVTIKVKRWQGLQMRLKDERQKVTNEVLNGIKVIKLYAWEEPMLKNISDIRSRELALIKKASIIKTIADIINIVSPFLVAIVTFATYMYSSAEHAMTPQIAFVSLTLFSQLRHPLIMVSELIGMTVQTLISHKRLKAFFVEEELDLEAVQRDSNPNFPKSIEVQMASFAWEHNQPKPTLRNIDFSVEKGALIAVVGKVGNGKSSLLSAILGEMEKLQGYVGVRGQCAFASQQAWIQNLSLRENILFGHEYDQKRYQEIVEACELRRDLEILPHGDYTEIGEKGINLSGGQKARVSLARAIYQNSDIYFLDDPLSAVDAIVGKALFDKAIGPRGLLKNKTRLLVTHSLGYLKACDKILVVKDGEITHYGAFDDLIEDPSVADILKTLEDSEDEGDEDSEAQPQSGDNDAENDSAPSSEPGSIRSRISKRGTASRSREFSKSKSSTTSATKKQESARMILDEQVLTGRVSSSVYYAYFRAMNLTFAFAFVGGFFLNIIFSVLRSLWLSGWSDATLADEEGARESLGSRLGVYGFLGVFEMAFLGVGNICLILGGVNASFNLHNPLILNLLKSPLQFFDTTPLGRVLNRVGKDMELVDLKLTGSFRFLIIAFFNVIQTLFIISMSTPLFIVIAVPMAAFYIFILRYFISSSRQLQRLSSITRSPLYAQFGETIQGAAVIRAFRASQRFFDNFCNTVDENLMCKYHSLISARWLGIRLELIGNVIILSAALLAVLSKSWGGMTAGVLGLSVSYSFNITMMLNFLIRQISEVETNIVAVERIKEYALTPTEASWESANEADKPPKNWPTEGKITFENYSTRYRPGLSLALRNLHADIQAKEKVGIAGRTGAGKSSLTLALFRIVEPAGGKIIIDNVDIASIGLHELRSRLTIIPQDPVLFSGTLRFNLDPFGNFNDSKLWMALEESHLKSFVETKPEGLSFLVSEGGENISSNYLIMDKPTLSHRWFFGNPNERSDVRMSCVYQKGRFVGFVIAQTVFRTSVRTPAQC
uniref:ABC-type glutathione-S-conjugate transporter n=1 Tax=Panagrellus redivivus TaxID=6233 RepID=A0A7E4VNW5_PANRE